MENQPPRLSRQSRSRLGRSRQSQSRQNKFDQVYVSNSFCGQGLFAAVAFHAMKPVGRILGEIKPNGYRSNYCMGFLDGAIEPYAPYRFINHSCQPNCELIEWEIVNEENAEKIYELWLHTIRSVTQDEELTIDYGWDWKAAIPCFCGDPQCRGWTCRLDELEECIRERGPGSKSMIQ